MKFDDKKICELIDYKPNKWQAEVRKSQARFKCIVAGRRSGKTYFVSNDPLVGIVKYLFEKEKNVWIVCPSYDLTERIWENLIKLCRGSLKPMIKKIFLTRGQQKIITNLGTVIEAKSADSPESLVGKGLDFLVCDESAMIDERAWNQSLRPSLVDRKGKAIFIGTPRRKNWFYYLYLKGKDPENKEYDSFHFSSFDNEYIDKAELDKIVEDMPEMEYQQEIMADFLEGFGQFFRKIDGCIAGKLEGPNPNHFYYIGVDLGKLLDFTVLCVMDGKTNELVHFERFKEIDWNLQKSRIEATARRYNNAQIILDTTGLGDPIIDDLRMVGLAVEDFKITTISKKQVLDKLSIAIEQKMITYPEIPELLSELESFGFWETNTKKLKYSAPPGMHDDCVISLALACWQLEKLNRKAKKVELAQRREFREPMIMQNPFHFNQ